MKSCGTCLEFRILLDGDVGHGSDGADLGKHADILDQLARLLDGFGGAVGIVELGEVDLASVDPALLVEHLEIADHGPSGAGAKSGCRAAERRRLTELDLGVAGPGAIGLLRPSGRDGEKRG